jgi:four helix bundle protein
MKINSANELKVYKAAYRLAIDIFNVSKTWPAEEKYSLTDQVRRSSRSVCVNLQEAWAKCRYKAHFISKLTDVDGENNETATWLSFANDCNYLSSEEYIDLLNRCNEIGKMIGSMLMRPEPFLLQI